MNLLVSIFTVLAISCSAFAKPFSFTVTELKSPRVNGVSEISIYAEKGDKWAVIIDLNQCNPLPSVCTTMAAKKYVVKPVVVSDYRGSDGDLTLQLTPEIKMVVSAGYNLDYQVAIKVEITSGGTVRSLALIPNVTVNTK